MAPVRVEYNSRQPLQMQNLMTSNAIQRDSAQRRMPILSEVF